MTVSLYCVRLLQSFHDPKLSSLIILAVESNLVSVGMHGDAKDDASRQQVLGGRAVERDPPQIVAVLRVIGLEQDGLAVCRPCQGAESTRSDTRRSPVYYPRFSAGERSDSDPIHPILAVFVRASDTDLPAIG